jgi:hypothetical protein
MATDLATVFTNAATAVTALVAATAGLIALVRGRRSARVASAPALMYVASGGAATPAGDLECHRPMSNAPVGTITELPRWTSSTKTPIVIIFVLLIAISSALLRRSSDVGPVSERAVPMIAHAEFTYDGSGNIVFSVAGTYDDLDGMTGVSIPTSSSERSDFSWVADLENVSGLRWDPTVSDLEQPAGLVAARLTLRTGDVSAYDRAGNLIATTDAYGVTTTRSTYAIARAGGDVTPVNQRMVYVYANGLVADVRNTDTWVKIGEGTLTPSGSWSVVGSVPDGWSRTDTTRLANANISLAAIVVSSEDAAIVTTTSTLADLDAMGRSEIVTVLLRRGQPGVVGSSSDAKPATGELRSQ